MSLTFFSVSGAAGLLDKKYCKITHILTRQISAVYICTIKMCDVAFFKEEGVREENYMNYMSTESFCTVQLLN